MLAGESEKLSYGFALDFIVRFLEGLGRREVADDLLRALESNLEVFADTLSRTLGKPVSALLWKRDGERKIVARASSSGPNGDPPIEWWPKAVGSVGCKPIVFREVQGGESKMIAAGFPFADEFSFDGELWLVLPDPTEDDRTFLRHLESWKAIKLILRLVVEQSVVRRFLAITPGLFDDQNSRSFLSPSGLRGLKNLGLSQCPPSMAPGFEDVLTTFVQAGLLVDFEASWTGLGRGSSLPNRASPLDNLGTELLDSLTQDSRYQSRIDILLALGRGAGCPEEPLASYVPPPETSVPYYLEREAQAWLAEWTGMLGSSNGEPSQGSPHGGLLGDGHWDARLESMLAACGRFLAGWSLSKEERISLEIFREGDTFWEAGALGASFITPWLRLWFCHELLRLELTDSAFRLRKQSYARRLRYRRSLIYVLRENVRFFLFWWRADYRFRPRLLARELRRLIVHHAERALGIDGTLDLTELLHRIERSGDAGAREVASGHLQHVFEVYIAGQFLGSLGSGKRSKTVDLWSHWTRRPDIPASLEKLTLRRAFGIAALLHDFGGLLFPSWGREIGGIRRLVQAVEGEMSRLASDLEAAGQRVSDAALAALRQHEGLFSDCEWEKIGRWQEERIKSVGEPEPALIGAWYVRSLMRQAGLSADLQRHVVRAMVLDRITSLPIDLESDPVAALLVVCDSLFVWEPSPPRRDELVIGRSFSSLQASGRSVAARYDSMYIPGLRFGLRKDEMTGGSRQQVKSFCADIDVESAPAVLAGAEAASETNQALAWGLPSFHLRSGDSERNDAEACLDLWLELSIALGRIGLGLDETDRSSRVHPLPWIRVTTGRPTELETAGLGIEDLVGEAAQQSTAALRRALERWLARNEEERRSRVTAPPSTAGTGKPGETTPVVFELNPRGRPFAEQDPRPWFEELRRRSERVILQRLAHRRRNGQ